MTEDISKKSVDDVLDAISECLDCSTESSDIYSALIVVSSKVKQEIESGQPKAQAFQRLCEIFVKKSSAIDSIDKYLGLKSVSLSVRSLLYKGAIIKNDELKELTDNLLKAYEKFKNNPLHHLKAIESVAKKENSSHYLSDEYDQAANTLSDKDIVLNFWPFGEGAKIHRLTDLRESSGVVFIDYEQATLHSFMRNVGGIMACASPENVLEYATPTIAQISPEGLKEMSGYLQTIGTEKEKGLPSDFNVLGLTTESRTKEHQTASIDR